MQSTDIVQTKEAQQQRDVAAGCRDCLNAHSGLLWHVRDAGIHLAEASAAGPPLDHCAILYVSARDELGTSE